MFPFAIIGCPESTDTDIVIMVDKETDSKQLNMEPYEMACRSLGYTGPLDSTCIIVKENEVIWCQHGATVDTHAIIYYTQSLHPNNVSIPLTEPKKLSAESRRHNLRKFVMDKMKKLLTPTSYTKLRAEKCVVFQIESEEQINAFFRVVLQAIQEELHVEGNMDTYKVLVMRILQVLYLEREEQLATNFFTKNGLVEWSHTQFGNEVYQEAKYFLYRGKKHGHASLHSILNLI